MSGFRHEGIIVLGMPRSGTTLVRRLLDAHPEIACPPETNLLNASARFLAEQAAAGGVPVGVLAGLGFSGFTREQVLERLRTFVFGLFGEIAARRGKRIWAEKTAADVFHLPQIEELCGERCRYICVYRQPLDVVMSLQDLSTKMQGYLPEIHEFVKRHGSYLEAFAHAWAHANASLKIFERSHPEWCCAVRYEDLVERPDAELARVFGFLGLEADAAAIRQQAFTRERAVDAGLGDWKTFERAGVDAASVGRGRGIDPATYNLLAGIVNPVAEQLGYAPLRHRDAPDDAEARRRYQLGIMLAGLKGRTGPSGQ